MRNEVGETAVYQPMKRVGMGWKRPWPVSVAYRGVGGANLKY
ncbi:MAG: hypothetical protein WBP47_17030 [Candidatus Promineifilaceae bacterium]